MGFADENVRAAIMGVRAVSDAYFPGTEMPIGIRALSESEIDEARLEAQCHFERICRLAQQDLVRFLKLDAEALDREHQRQCLARAVVEAGDAEAPFFQDASQVRKLLPVQVERLWELYLDHQNAIAPRVTLTPERVAVLAESLKKKQDSKVLLEAFERDTLCNLVRILAFQLSEQQTPS